MPDMAAVRLRAAADVGDDLRILRMVSLVIAVHVKHRYGPIGKSVNGCGAVMNVAGDHQQIGIARGNAAVAGKPRGHAFKVQVGADLDFHLVCALSVRSRPGSM